MSIASVVRSSRLLDRIDSVRIPHRPPLLSNRHSHARLGQYRRDERAANARERRERLLVLLLDALKGFVPDARGHCSPSARDARRQSSSRRAPCSAIAFRRGLRFKGGKGVATSFGAIFALSWPAGLVAVGGWLGGRRAHALLLGRFDARERARALRICGSLRVRCPRRPTASSQRSSSSLRIARTSGACARERKAPIRLLAQAKARRPSLRSHDFVKRPS